LQSWKMKESKESWSATRFLDLGLVARE
jgi:hypothetical protein